MMNEILNTEDLIAEANKAYQNGEYLQAANLFESASKNLENVGDSVAAAEQLNNCSVAYLQANQAQDAFRVCEGTIEIFNKAGNRRNQGMAFGNLGAALEALGRHEEAIDAYQKSADLLKQVGDDNLYASVMQSISRVNLRQGRQVEALASMQEGLAEVKKPNIKQRLLKKLLHLPVKLTNIK